MYNFRSITVALFLALVSCVTLAQETLNWTNDIPPGGWPNGSLGPHSNTTQCHSRGTLTSQIANPLGLTLPGTTPFSAGVNSNSIILGMSGAPNAQGITQTITFTYPIENLSFSIFDIDGNAGNWQDRLIITANSGATSVPVTINTCPTAAGTTCTGSGTVTAQIDAGTAPTGFTSAAGRADISVAGSLDSVTIQYQNHTVPTSTTQFISITQLTFNCAIIGASKVMTRRAGQAAGVSPYLVDIDFNFENFGDLNISNLTALEDLNSVFNMAPNSGNFTVDSITKTSGPASFNENASFDGDTDLELIAPGSSLSTGQTASLRVTLSVNNYDSYTNTITVTGTTPQMATTSDDSTNGTVPDGSDSDDNPDESIPSVLNVQTLPATLNYFSSIQSNGSTIVEWQTDIEYNHLGFKVYQENKYGQRNEISPMITQARTQLDDALKTYTFKSDQLSQHPLWLAEISTNNETTWYGPIQINDSQGQKIADAAIEKPVPKTIEKNHHNSNDLSIEVTESGMHRITYQDLIDAGFDMSNTTPGDVVITLDNRTMPLYINGNRLSFDNSTSFDFYADGFNSIYTDQRIYRLSNTLHRKAYIVDDHTHPSTEMTAWYWQSEQFNDNRIYDSSSPSDDPWRAETLSTFGTSNKGWNFPLDELFEDNAEPIELYVNISGGLNYRFPPETYPSDPNRCGADHPDLYPGMPNDHCVELSVNGVEQQDIVFDGLSVFKKSYQLDESIADSGIVNVTLNVSGETGFPHDIINIEEIGIKYPRRTTAIGDVLFASINTSLGNHTDFISNYSFEDEFIEDSIDVTNNSALGFAIDGFTNNAIVAYALHPHAPVRINNLKINHTGDQINVLLPHIAHNNTYWVSTEQALLKPVLKPWHQTQNIIHPNADYVMITHPDFIETASQLADYHTHNGLNVEIINVNDIYAHFSASIVDPKAIKSYIAELAKYNHLKYVLLIGSDNYDYKGYLSSSHFSHIPSLYTPLDDEIRYTPADSLFTDIDNDNIPDIAIGRIPARNNNELQLLIDKQMTFIAQNSQNMSTHFIADAQDENYSYREISNQLMSLLPENWSKTSTFRDNFNSNEAVRQNILDNFAAHPRLTTYLGHSSRRIWFSFPSPFTYNDIDHLSNHQSASVVVQWGCWNSYYVEPSANTMAHKFLFNSDKGAVAVFGASALTLVSSEKAFAELLLPQFAIPGQNIGTSMINAKKQLSEAGDYRDIIIGWNLLGDPALQMSIQTP